eukprot:Sspe_Gene.34391::Locus_16722_Transcript_1_1_Confidence_1.000_Length_1500::g.34391::m.34391
MAHAKDLPDGFPMPAEVVRRWREATTPIVEQLMAVDPTPSGLGEEEYPSYPPPPPVRGGRMPKDLSCPVMSPEEAKAITVQYGDEARLTEVMDKYGVAIVANVATPDEVKQLEGLWMEDLTALASRGCTMPRPWSRFMRKGAEGWPSATALGTKLTVQRAINHGSLAWAARMHPRVKQCFATLHETSDLVTGNDALFFKPGGYEVKDEDRFWCHSDVCRHMEGGEWKCVQGVLYVWGSDHPGASTTVVCPGTHREVYDEMMADPAMTTLKSHFCSVTKIYDRQVREKLLERAHSLARRVPVPAGGLLLWDSRLLHQGWGGGKRLAVPVCWEPRERRTPAARKRKLWMVGTGTPSRHWASLGSVHSAAPKRPSPQDDGECEDSTPHDFVRFPLHASLVPYPITDTKAWLRVLPTLWGAGPDSCPRDALAVLEEVIDPRILEVL